MSSRHLVLACAALAALIVSGCGPSGPRITALAPKDAVLLMVIQSEALINHPDLKPLIEAGQRMNQRMKPAFDPLTMSEIHFSLCPRAPGDTGIAPLMPLVVVKFRTAADLATALKSAPAGNFVDADHGGKKYKRDKRGFGEAQYQLDDRTIVVAPERLIKSFIDSSTPPAALLDAINRPGIKGQIRMAYIPGQEKAQLDQFRQPPFSQMMPPPLFKLLDVPKHVTMASMSIHVAGDEFFRIELDTAGGSGTTEVKERLDGAVKFSRETVAALLDMQLSMAPLPPDTKNLAKPFVNETLGKIQVATEGSRVVVSLPVSPELGKMMRDNMAKTVKQVEDAQKASVAAADRMRRSNNLKQLALGAIIVENATRRFPDDYRDPSGKPILSWRVAVLPFVEEKLLHNQFDLKQPWNSPRNAQLVASVPFPFQTLGGGLPNSPPNTNVVRFVGQGALFNGIHAPRYADIRDGSSNTLLFVEAGPSKAVHWAQPGDVPFDVNDPIRALGDIPPAGFQAAFCDGSVRTIPPTVSPQALAALICPNDGIPITWSPTGEPTVPPGSKINIQTSGVMAPGTNTPPPPPSIPGPLPNPTPLPVPPNIPQPPVIPQPAPPPSGGTPMSATLYFANNDDQRRVELFVNGMPWNVPPQRYNKHGVKFEFQFKSLDVIVAKTSDRGNGELAWALVDSTGKLLSYSKVGLPIHINTPDFADFAKGQLGRSVAATKGFIGTMAADQVKGEAKGLALPADFASIWAPKQNEPVVAVKVFP